MATLDPDLSLVAVLTQDSEQFTVRREELGSYLQPKKPWPLSAQTLRTSQHGIPYTKTAFAYQFQYSPAA